MPIAFGPSCASFDVMAAAFKSRLEVKEQTGLLTALLEAVRDPDLSAEAAVVFVT